MGIRRFDQYGSNINGPMCYYSDVEHLIDEHKLELEKCYSEIADKESLIKEIYNLSYGCKDAENLKHIIQMKLR